MRLIVVDSKSKQTQMLALIRKSNLSDVSVVSCDGNFCDFPKSSLGLDLKSFSVIWKNQDPQTIDSLGAKIAESSSVWSCMDPSPGGESLSFHVEVLASAASKPFYVLRVVPWTVDLLLSSLASHSPVDMGLVNSYVARRMISRVVDHLLSPIFSSKLSPVSLDVYTLPLLSELARAERQSRKPQSPASWILRVLLEDGTWAESAPHDSMGPLNAIASRVRAASSEFTSTRILEMPLAPFTLSSLLQFMSQRYLVDTLSCVNACESLYSLGYITYPFTGNDLLPLSVVQSIRSFVSKQFSSDLLSPDPLFTTSNSDGGMAISPTSIDLLPSKLELAQDLKLVYSAIWFRAVGSQGKPSVSFKQERKFFLDSDEILSVRGKETEVLGWHQLSSRIFEVVEGLPLTEGSPLVESSVGRSPLKPSFRHTYGTLIRWMDDHHMSNPWAYRNALSRLSSNGLVSVLPGGQLSLTPFGETLVTLAKRFCSSLLDPSFVAEQEACVAQVREGTLALPDFLSNYYDLVSSLAETLRPSILRPPFSSPRTNEPLQVLLDDSGAPYAYSPSDSRKYPLVFDVKGKFSLKGDQI